MNKEKNMEMDILTEAETLFLEKGFNMATTTEIAKRVGCNQALVHYYFRTKEKLFEAVFFKKLEIFISSFLHVDQRELSFEEKLRFKIESHFDVLFKNQKLPYMVISEMITNPVRIKSFKAMLSGNPIIYSQFVSEFEKEIQAGRIRNVSPVDILFNAIALNLSVFLMKPITMEILDLDEEEFIEFAMNRKKENVITVLNSLKP
jgi:TetR/AcrR family transcriptional regulator